MEQPVTEWIARAAPYVTVGLATGAIYLSLLSLSYTEARARVRAYLALRERVEGLLRYVPAGVQPSAPLRSAQNTLSAMRQALIRDGILPADPRPR